MIEYQAELLIKDVRQKELLERLLKREFELLGEDIGDILFELEKAYRAEGEELDQVITKVMNVLSLEFDKVLKKRQETILERLS